MQRTIVFLVTVAIFAFIGAVYWAGVDYYDMEYGHSGMAREWAQKRVMSDTMPRLKQRARWGGLVGAGLGLFVAVTLEMRRRRGEDVSVVDGLLGDTADDD